MTFDPTDSPLRRHILCNACFAVYVPEYEDGTYGPCQECLSLKTAIQRSVPENTNGHRSTPLTQSEEQHQ